jgi:glycosyltransferase involved in cell wall biosynthesis
MTADITVHCLVRNEEYFVAPALRSVLPLARRVLVYDTGSTDATLDEIAAIGSERIEVVRKSDASPRRLTEYRNEMIEQTTTEWFWLVDGDEIYPARALPRLAAELARVPAGIHRIVIARRHFVHSLNYLTPFDALGRVYRTRHIRIVKDYPRQTSCLKDEPAAPFSAFSMAFPRDVFFFHGSHLPRSSKDADLGRLRGWRQLPFPVLPYFGPWPETLDVRAAVPRPEAATVARAVGLNARIVWARLLARAMRALPARSLSGSTPAPHGSAPDSSGAHRALSPAAPARRPGDSA